VNEKSDPVPTKDSSSSIEHPIAVNILLQLLRPIPVPDGFKAFPSSRSSKGTNNFSLS